MPLVGFGTPLASLLRRAVVASVTPQGSVVEPGVDGVLPRSLLMNISSTRPAPLGAGRWSLTRSDVLLCAVPIALFLSIVSFV